MQEFVFSEYVHLMSCFVHYSIVTKPNQNRPADNMKDPIANEILSIMAGLHKTVAKRKRALEVFSILY